MSAICPSILSTVVNNDRKKGEKIYKIRTFTSYMVTLRHLKQQGYKYLNAKYTKFASNKAGQTTFPANIAS